MDTINGLNKKKEYLLNIASKLIIEKRNSILKKKKVIDIFIPSFLASTCIFLFFIPKEIVKFFNLEYGFLFNTMMLLDKSSIIVFLLFAMFVLFKFNIFNGVRTTYNEEKKMNDFISNKQLTEFIKYSKSLSISLKKSEIKNLYTKELDSFVLDKEDITDIMKLIKSSSLTQYSSDRILKKYITENGINLINAIELINEVIEEDKIFNKIKSKEKFLEYVKSI